MFDTCLNKHERFYSPVGEGKVNVYELRNGSLEKVDTIDIKHDIQLVRAACDNIEDMMTNFVDTLDASQLRYAGKEDYFDLRGVPQDPDEAIAWAKDIFARYAEAAMAQAETDKEENESEVKKNEE